MPDLTILIVNDDKQSRTTTSQILYNEGYHTIACATSAGAKSELLGAGSSKTGIDLLIYGLSTHVEHPAKFLFWKRENALRVPTVVVTKDVGIGLDYIRSLHEAGAKCVVQEDNFDFDKFLPSVALRFCRLNLPYTIPKNEAIFDLTQNSQLLALTSLSQRPIYPSSTVAELFNYESKSIPAGIIIDDTTIKTTIDVVRLRDIFPTARMFFLGEARSLPIASALEELRCDCAQTVEELTNLIPKRMAERDSKMEKLLNTPRQIVLLAGPTAAGKDTHSQIVVKANPKYARLVTDTSREPRKYEENGVDHYFLNKQEMLSKKSEYTWFYEHNGICYGLPKTTIETALLSGHSIITHTSSMDGLNSFDRAFGAQYQSNKPRRVLLLKREEEAIAAAISRGGPTIKSEALTQDMSEFLFNRQLFDKFVLNPTYEIPFESSNLQFMESGASQITTADQVLDMRLNAAVELIRYLSKPTFG